MKRNRLPALGLVLGVAVCVAACGSNPPAGGPEVAPRPNPPIVTVQGVALATAPTSVGVAKYFCPKVANALACRILGSPPQMAELAITFDVTLAVENPNDVALPAVEALVAMTAYPGAVDVGNVGAVCFSICDEGAACAPPAEDGCATADHGLRSMGDYATARPGLLHRGGPPGSARIRTIGPRQTEMITVRLEVGAHALLDLIKLVALDMLDTIVTGSVPSVVIPLQIEGTVWVEVGAFGKISAGFGPVDDRWTLE